MVVDGKRRKIPVQSIAVRFHTPTCDQARLIDNETYKVRRKICFYS